MVECEGGRVKGFSRLTDNARNFPQENEGKSRADAILDLMKERHLQRKVLHAYRHSAEPKKVRAAVMNGIDENDSPPSHVHRYVRFTGLTFQNTGKTF